MHIKRTLALPWLASHTKALREILCHCHVIRISLCASEGKQNGWQLCFDANSVALRKRLFYWKTCFNSICCSAEVFLAYSWYGKIKPTHKHSQLCNPEAHVHWGLINHIRICAICKATSYIHTYIHTYIDWLIVDWNAFRLICIFTKHM